MNPELSSAYFSDPQLACAKASDILRQFDLPSLTGRPDFIEDYRVTNGWAQQAFGILRDQGRLFRFEGARFFINAWGPYVLYSRGIHLAEGRLVTAEVQVGAGDGIGCDILFSLTQESFLNDGPQISWQISWTQYDGNAEIYETKDGATTFIAKVTENKYLDMRAAWSAYGLSMEQCVGFSHISAGILADQLIDDIPLYQPTYEDVVGLLSSQVPREY